MNPEMTGRTGTRLGALTVYPPDDEDDLGPELLGPDGEVILRRRLNPIGFGRTEE